MFGLKAPLYYLPGKPNSRNIFAFPQRMCRQFHVPLHIELHSVCVWGETSECGGEGTSGRDACLCVSVPEVSGWDQRAVMLCDSGSRSSLTKLLTRRRLAESAAKRVT